MRDTSSDESSSNREEKTKDDNEKFEEKQTETDKDNPKLFVFHLL